MSCSACAKTLKITQGNNRTLKLRVVDADGNLLDITGFKIYFTVKQRLEDPYKVIYKRSAAAGGSVDEILIPAQVGSMVGRANILILPADTTNIKTGTYICDVTIEDLGGVVTTVVPERELVIGPRVTILV